MVLVVPVAAAQDTDEFADTGVLKGQVFNLHYESGVPHAYVLVESNTGYKEARTTDESGDYKFNLPYGTYSMRVFVRDQEMDNASNIFVDPSGVVHDVLIDFAIEEPVHLHGVIRVEGFRVRSEMVVFEGLGNSYRNETVTDKEGRYAVDVPFGNVRVMVYEGNDFVGDKDIGPFVEAGDQEVKMDLIRSGEPPSLGDWTNFIVATWTGMAIWGAIVFGLIVGYFYLARRVDLWLAEEKHRFSEQISEMMAYTIKGYSRVLFLYLSLVALDVFLEIEHQAAQWIRFWLWALVMVLILWVTARFLMKLIDYMMIRLRQQRLKEGSEVPETAYIFIHGILRYVVITIFGFFILLIVLSGAGLYDEIAGGFTGFIDVNFGYIVFLVIIVVLYFITNRFVRLTFAQMSETSTRFTPQMLRIIGFIARIGIIGLFSVLFIFVLLTMAGMQEMGALIMALLTTTVGMIVAMTTTGAIGNALAGMVIMTLKPIQPGQYVEVGDDQFGYVVDVGTFFTKLKTFENVIIEIPNNLVLAKE
ncbi:MAG: mechanosensitive ion channel family protein, partial [Thermoplasmata archaeon]